MYFFDFKKIENIYKKCVSWNYKNFYDGLLFYNRTNILLEYILYNNKINNYIIDRAFRFENGKLTFNHLDDIKYVGALLFEKFYNQYNSKAWEKYIDFINKKFGFDYRWFNIYLPFLFTSKYLFIQKSLEYVIKHQNNFWKEKFQQIDINKYSWLRPINTIPKNFDDFLDLYIWIEDNNVKDYLNFIISPNIATLVHKIIENDLIEIQMNGFNGNSFKNIDTLLQNCKDDYKILSEIFTHEALPLKLWFLSDLKTIGIGLMSLQDLSLVINTYNRKNKFDLEYEKTIAKEINYFVFKSIKSLQYSDKYAKNFPKVICFYDNHINFDNVNFLYEEFLNFLIKKEIYQNPYEKEKYINLIFDEFYKEYTQCFNINSFYSLSKIIGFVKEEFKKRLALLFIDSLKKEIEYYEETLLENLDYNLLIKYLDIEELLQLNYRNESSLIFYFHLLLNFYKFSNDIRIKQKLIEIFLKFDKHLYYFRNPFKKVDFTNKFFQLDFNEEEIKQITDFLEDFSLLLKFYSYQKNRYIKKKILNFNQFTLNDIKESFSYLADNKLYDLANKIYLKFKNKIDCKSYKYKEYCLELCNYKLIKIFKSDKNIEEKINELNQILEDFKFNDLQYLHLESYDLKCENYKQFLVALLYLETDTKRSYKILQQVLDRKEHRLYLYNMLNILIKLQDKEQLEIYLKKLYEYDKNFKYEKSEFENFTLLNVYMFLNEKDKFEKLWQKIPIFIKQKKEFKKLIDTYENETLSYVISLTQHIKNYKNKIFDFAFSFVGSDDVRNKLKKIKNELQQKGYEVFYDEDFTSEMQKLLHPKDYLEKVFKTSKYIIIIIDENYFDKIRIVCDFKKFEQKCYVKFEFETIKQRVNSYGREFLLMFKSNDISLNKYGLNSDVYFPIEKLSTDTILNHFKEK